MTFVEDARNFLRRDFLPQITSLLGQEDYAHRLIFRQGVEVDKARAFRAFREDRESTGDLLEDQELDKQPRLLLIGDAGSGKSFILAFAYLQAAQRFLKNLSAPFPLFLDLDKDLPTQLNIQGLEEALEYKHKGFFRRALTESPTGYAFFFDSLDEVLQTAPRFVNDLEFFLQKHHERLTHVLVACRRAMWNPQRFSTGLAQLAVYHADHLGWEEYAQILPDRTSQQAFFTQCNDLGIESLLETPFDDFYLAREFRAGRPLPRTRHDCLNQRITAALQGRENDRRDGQSAPLDRLRFLARQLACLTSFLPHHAWTEQNVIDLLGSSEVLRLDQPVQPQEVQTLLRRPLFRRTDDRFAFTHQLYQEFLAAEALGPLPLRKQRQLLESSRPELNRIRPPYRGIAMCLAESSEVFCRYLLTSDALVALFAELSSLSSEQDEELLYSVLDNAVANDYPPWWQVPPRGERPVDALAKHRPRDISIFLRPYLECPDEIPQLWGTACAAAWKGAKSLNGILNQIAHDPQRNVEARIRAIEAIAATKDWQDVHTLYDLFDDPDDQIRAQVLQAYRQLDAPAPREFMAKLKGGARDPNLLCLLQSEAENYGHLLELSQLPEAFQVVTENFEDLGNLKRYILRGLFSRAIELDFADIPANLIIKCWIGEKGRSTVSDSLLREEKTIPQLLTKHPELFEKVWTLTLNLAGQEDERIYTNGLANLLGGVCTDRIFALIPPTTEGLTWSQQRLIVSVLGPYFGKEPTQERLLRFQQSAPVFTQRLRLPQPPKQPPPRDPLEDKQKLLNALKQGKENPLAQTWYVLLAVTALERKIKHPEPPPEEKVLHVLARIAPSARRLILAAFRGCVARVRYEYERIGPSQYSMTREEYEVPFWILQHYGEKFTSQKLAEIISCYAFSGIRNAEKGRYEAPCEELRHQDWELWRQCMWRWLEEDSSSLNSSLQYLTKISERFYLPRCAERLEQNLFGASTFSPLLNYLLAFRPAGYIETLQRCYRILKDRLCQKERQSQEQSPTDNRDWAETGSEQAQVEHPPDASPDPRVLSYWHQFRPLLALMGEDDEWAWDEFAGRLALEDVPLDDSFHLFSGFRFPLNERRLPMLADWYALIRRKTDDSHFVAFSLAPRLLETIVTIGGQSAIQELRRLQRDRSFPSARWLSHEIMRIEDNLLTEEIGGWESRSLLDFVNKEKLGVVLNEHDLFEWVCQAIEEVQEAFERRGEAVTGFWNGNEPKTEPQCQNVLWPLLQLTLRKSSIAAVEVQEFSIGPNYCDFCVQYPRSGQPPFRVAVELKRLAKAMGRLSLSIPSKPSCGKSICAQPSVSTGSSAYFGSVTINVTKVLPIGLVVISLPRRYARNVRPLWPLTNL